jgi:hypothetical protein
MCVNITKIKYIYLISGYTKSGKDYFSNNFQLEGQFSDSFLLTNNFTENIRSTDNFSDKIRSKDNFSDNIRSRDNIPNNISENNIRSTDNLPENILSTNDLPDNIRLTNIRLTNIRSTDNFPNNFAKYSIYSKNNTINDLKYIEKSETIKFATPLIQHINNIFNNGEPHEIRKDQKLVLYNGTIRDYMKEISIGIKKIDLHFFAKHAANEIIKNNMKYVKISDFRFEEEINYFKEFFNSNEYKIITIRVHRTGIEIPNFIISENSLDNFDFDFFVVPHNLEEKSTEEIKCHNSHFLNCKKIN